MPAAIKNITVEAGVGFELEATWKDSGEEPVDLDGYTGQAQMREGFSSTRALLSFAVEFGDDPGSILVKAGAEQTRAAVAAAVGREAVWDLELTPPEGEPIRLLKGKAHLSPEATR
jgi:hypothetical protein